MSCTKKFDLNQRVRIVIMGLLVTAFNLGLPAGAFATGPAWFEEDQLEGDNLSMSGYGYSVAVDGGTAVVGAFFENTTGAAYVFEKSGGNWSRTEKLIPSGVTPGTMFGMAAAISGDTVVVGASYDNDAGSKAGAAYVFVKSGGTWTQQSKLVASDASADANFGNSVTIEGDQLVVGSYKCQSEQGSAYVFTRSGTSWTEQQILTASDGDSGDEFGTSVDMDNGVLVVGAHVDSDAGSASGSAYVFTGSGSSWTEQTKLYPTTPSGSDFFGFSVAVSGNTIMVGAPGEDGEGPDSSAGTSYVFTGSGSSWTQQAKLTSDDLGENDYFGFSVGLNNDTAVIGAKYNFGNARLSGAAYVFTRSGTVWTQSQKLLPASVEAMDIFGHSVSMDANSILVGSQDEEYEGSAYLFDLRSESATITTSSNELIFPERGVATGPSDPLSIEISSTGDIDLVLTASVVPDSGIYSITPGSGDFTMTPGDSTTFDVTFDPFQDGPNNCVLRLVSNDPFTPRVDIPLRGMGSGRPVMEFAQKVLANNSGDDDDNFGYAVAIDGDIAVVGSPYDDDGQYSIGSAYVFRRINEVWTFDQKVIGTISSKFGSSVAIQGEVIFIGAPGHQLDKGALYIFSYSGSSWTQTAIKSPGDLMAYDRFGQSIAISGDMLLVGAPGYPSNTPSSGAAYFYKKTGSNWNQAMKATASDGSQDDLFGASVAIDSDYAVIGAPNYDNDIEDIDDIGAAYIFQRTTDTDWSEQAKLVPGDTLEESDHFGATVGMSGDSAFAGAPEKSTLGLSSGAVYTFTRSGTTWPQTQRLTPVDGYDFDEFGASIFALGDRLLIGSFGFHCASEKVYVYARSDNTWVPTNHLSPDDNELRDGFGVSVSTSGDTVVVGAYEDDESTGEDAGSVYFYEVKASPAVVVTPSSLDFGLKTVNSGPSAAKVLTIENEGDADLHATISLIDNTDGGFQITSGNLSPTITPGNSSTLEVVFDPSVGGNNTASVRIESDDPSYLVYDIPLSGYCYTSELLPAPTGVFVPTFILKSPTVEPNGEPVEYTYVWTSNNGDMVTHGPKSETSDTLIESELIDNGETWTVTVTPNNGYVDGLTTTANVTIKDGPAGVEFWWEY